MSAVDYGIRKTSYNLLQGIVLFWVWVCLSY